MRNSDKCINTFPICAECQFDTSIALLCKKHLSYKNVMTSIIFEAWQVNILHRKTFAIKLSSKLLYRNSMNKLMVTSQSICTHRHELKSQLSTILYVKQFNQPWKNNPRNKLCSQPTHPDQMLKKILLPSPYTKNVDGTKGVDGMWTG